MLLDRFIRIQIWNSAGTSIEYDNKVDGYWGISANSITLNKVICPSELSFGDVNSSMLELQIFGLDVDLSRRKIRLIAEDKVQEDTYLATEDDDPIVTENSEYLHGGFAYVDVNTPLFTGYIDSTETDYEGTYRDIVAYDWFYFHRDDNIWGWIAEYQTVVNAGWSYSEFEYPLYDIVLDEHYFENTQGFSYTVDSFLTYIRNTIIDLPTIDPITIGNLISSYFNPTIKIHNLVNAVTNNDGNASFLSLADMFKFIFEPMAIFIYIDGYGDIQFSQVHTLSEDEITASDYEHENSSIQPYTIGSAVGLGIRIYDDIRNKFLYEALVYPQPQSAYDITGNKLLYKIDNSATMWHNVALGIRNNISTVNRYTPCELHMILSDFKYQLGDYIKVEKKNSYFYAYIMEIEYSGSLLVEQTIKCNAQGKYLTSKIS